MQEEKEASPAAGSFRWISVTDDQFPLESDKHELQADDTSEDDFEFAFLVRDTDLKESSNITADDIFSDGQILPMYPVFNRDLVDIKEGNEEDDDDDHETEDENHHHEEDKAVRGPLRRLLIEDPQVCSRSGSISSSSSSAEEPETAPPGTYCFWEPRSVPASPDRRRRSTGTSHKWRLRDLVVGRSQSDGKGRYVFLSNEDGQPQQPQSSGTDTNRLPGKDKISSSATSSPARSEQAKKGKAKTKKVTEMDMVTAHRLFYGKDGAGAASGRRSFLPYKPVGLFANVKVLSRAHHPF